MLDRDQRRPSCPAIDLQSPIGKLHQLLEEISEAGLITGLMKFMTFKRKAKSMQQVSLPRRGGDTAALRPPSVHPSADPQTHPLGG